MNREFEARFTAILLTLLTVAARSVRRFQLQDRSSIRNSGRRRLVDGAERPSDGRPPGARWASGAGWNPPRRRDCQHQRPRRSDTAAAVTHRLYDSGVWSKATYSLIRGSVPLDVEVVLVPAERSMNDWLRLIALIYLSIGLYVLMRRWTAVGSTHFYIFCLVSFVFYSLHYTGKFNAFDWAVSLGQ